MSRRERSQGAPPVAATPLGAERQAARPAPPPKHPWQLAISSLLMALWVAVLAWMAWG